MNQNPVVHNRPGSLAVSTDRRSIEASLGLCVDELLPGMKLSVLARAERLFSSDNRIEHWKYYQAEKSNVLCWPNCGACVSYLHQGLHRKGIKSEPVSNTALPMEAMPFAYSRGREGSVARHVLLHVPGAGELTIVDPTWRQFCLFLVPYAERWEALARLTRFAGEVLVLPENGRKQFCDELSRIVRSHGFGQWGPSLESTEALAAHLSRIWDPAGYHPAEPEDLPADI